MAILNSFVNGELKRIATEASGTCVPLTSHLKTIYSNFASFAEVGGTFVDSRKVSQPIRGASESFGPATTRHLVPALVPVTFVICTDISRTQGTA